MAFWLTFFVRDKDTWHQEIQQLGRKQKIYTTQKLNQMSAAVSRKLFNVFYKLDQDLIKYSYNPAKSCNMLRQSSKGLGI